LQQNLLAFLGAGREDGAGIAEGLSMWFKEMGKKIQRAREERGMTQMDLARALGITQAALSNYELGKRRLYLHQIEELSQVLQKNIDYFIPSPEQNNRTGAFNTPKTRERIVSRIHSLDETGLGLLSAYLDYLEWRRHHG
jgi:transcriptional regulator with XRE-family HTH domain